MVGSGWWWFIVAGGAVSVMKVSADNEIWNGFPLLYDY